MLGSRVAPLVGRRDHQTSRHVRCRVESAGLIDLSISEAMQRRVVLNLPVNSPRVGVEQEFVWVESKSGLGPVGPGHTVTVRLAGADAGNETVPYAAVILRPSASKRQRSTLSAPSAPNAKLVPSVVAVAPKGNQSPGSSGDDAIAPPFTDHP
jgi:hypothetical protein